MSTPTYHLFIDDSGSRFIDRPTTPPRQDGLDYFAMGGLLIRAEDVEVAVADLGALRARHNITAPFHSTKMRSKRKEWAWLGTESERERADKLYADLKHFLCSINGYATACVVHRPGYNARYGHYPLRERWQICKSAYSILVERMAKIAFKENRKISVYVEQSGKKEDSAIRSYHTDLRNIGMSFNPITSERYAPLSSDCFSSTLLENPNFFTKSLLMGQIADLLLYPLVKGRYDPSYGPYCDLKAAKRLIDDVLLPENANCGIKYFCFDGL